MSAVATPPAMFAPARLCTRRAPARSRMPATIAAVVVLPLVAEMTALPRCRRAPRRAMAWGSRRIRSLPGSDVPPRPVAPRQRAGGARGRDLDVEGGHAGSRTCSAAGQGAEGHRQLADRVAVGVDGERAVGVDAHLGAAQHVHARLVDVLALEHLGQHAAQEARLARALEPDDVERPRRRARRRARRTSRRRRPWSSPPRRPSRRSATRSPSTSRVNSAGFQAPARAGRRRRRRAGRAATAPRWRSGWPRSRSPARRSR